MQTEYLVFPAFYYGPLILILIRGLNCDNDSYISVGLSTVEVEKCFDVCFVQLTKVSKT